MQIHMRTPREPDRRRTQRFDLNAPLTLQIGSREIPAFTRNLSNHGVYFCVSSDDSPDVGECFEFLIELPAEVTLSSACEIPCFGRAVRIQRFPWNETGVAAEILHYTMTGKKTATTS